MDLTFQKDKRILKSSDFRHVLRRGRRFRRSSLTIVALAGNSRTTRFGLTVSKKVGNAVVRNRVKRRFREIARHQGGGLPSPWNLVIIAQPGAGEASFQALWNQIKSVVDELARLERGKGRTRTVCHTSRQSKTERS